MLDTWNDNKVFVAEVNEHWKQGQELYSAFCKERGLAALKMEELMKVMTDQAMRIHGTTNIRTEPIVEEGNMTGIKVWVNETCKIFKEKV